MPKNLFLSILTYTIGSLLATESCFGGGLSDAALAQGTLNGEALRQELVMELAKAKAGVKTGTAPEELKFYERNITAATELAETSLSDQQKELITSAVSAIHQTRAAWLVALDRCHHAVEQNSLAASAVILGAHSGNCSDDELAASFAQLGVLTVFGKFYDPNFAFSLMPDYKGPPLEDYTKIGDAKRPRTQLLRATLLQPLLKICETRLEAAIRADTQ
jgi:hypothetical protein